MKKLLIIALLLNGFTTFAQSPIVTSWLQNRTGIKGRHYVAGNSTPIQDNDSANVQQVFYSTNWAYIRTKGIPAYISGPFLEYLNFRLILNKIQGRQHQQQVGTLAYS